MPISIEKATEYRKININGFTVDFSSMVYASGNHPSMRKSIYSEGNLELYIEVEYFESYRGNTFRIMAQEWQRTDNNLMMCGTEYYRRKIYEESAARFNFKKIQAMCAEITESKEQEIISNYKNHKSNKNIA